MAGLKEQGKKLGQRIRFYTSKEPFVDHTGFDDKPNLWRKPEFVAQVLYHAVEQRYYAPDKKTLIDIKNEFTNETKLEIDVEGLLEKEWLQIATCIVHIPATLRGSVHSLRKIKDCRNELLFLKTLKKDKNEGFLITEFEQLTEKYKQKNRVELSIENAKKAHIISIKDDTVKVNNVEYYDLIVQNWNEFLFLDYFYNKIYGEESNLIISKETLLEIHSDHKKKYTLTPCLPEMLASGLANETPDGYVITLLGANYCSDDTIDEAGALLWRIIENSKSSLSNECALMKWCRKMIIKCNHHCNVFKYLFRGERDPFCRAIVALLIKEPNLNESPTEYRKALLDYHMSRDLFALEFAERMANFKFAKDSKDAFDTLSAISKAQRGSTDDYLYFAQSSRDLISYLVGQIVKSHSCEDFPLDRINDLTKDIHLKPYLLWTFCFWLWEWKPELVPQLMHNTAITSALFAIQKKLVINVHTFEPEGEIRFRIASELFKHLLTVLQSTPEKPTGLKAKIIFDCLLATTIPQFQVKGLAPKLQREIQETTMKISKDIRNEFANRPNQYPIYDNHIHTKEKFYPLILRELFALGKALNSENNLPNATLDFNYEKISLILFFSKLSKDIPENSKLLKLPNYEVAQAILDCYLNTISAISAPSLDYETWNLKQVTPIFIPTTQNIEAIDWASAYILTEEENLANQFLNPLNLTFNKTGDEYDSYNRFIMDKLRAHLKILIDIYRKLIVRKITLSQRGILIESYLQKLENAILDITISYSLNEPDKRRFDIFNYIDERPTFKGREEELIPQLGEISNHFSAPNRDRLIAGLIRTDVLIRAVKLVETMTSEQDQKFLLNKINRLNLLEELEQIPSLNDIQFLLGTLTKYIQLQDKAKELLSFWDTNIVTRENGFLTNEIKVATYRAKLLIAFQANDLKAIEEVTEPEGDVYLNTTKLYPNNEKDFYRALYFLHNGDPQQAYSLYNDLIYRKDEDSTSIALNRFAAKIRCAEIEIDSVKKYNHYSEALSEWNLYQKKLPEGTSIEHIAVNLLHNRLVSLDAIERYDEFDGFYAELTYVERVKPGFFEIGVRNRIKRKMVPEAISLIKEAELFHKLKDDTIPEFVNAMRNLIPENEDPETLKDIISTLLTAKPDVLVKLIPDSVNDGKNPTLYILNEIVSAANNMLSNINALANVSDEDKYSDLINVSLNSSMKIHHWKASRANGGFSDSTLLNPGQIDIKIFGPNNEELAICEAFSLTYNSNKEIAKHCKKIFNYTASKKGLFILVYYKGREVSYLNKWEKYKDSIQNKVKFPESYRFEVGSFADSSGKHNNAAIRVGTSSHGNGIILYHVFINVNYKATAVK